MPSAASGTAPAATGGTITAGLYYLTSSMLYGIDAGASWTPVQQAMLITGSGGAFVAQIVRAQPGYGCERGTLSLSAASSPLTATETCGDLFGGNEDDGGSGADSGTMLQTVPYTATGTTLCVQTPQDGGAVIEVDTYTLQ